MSTNIKLKRLKLKLDIVEKPENRVHKLTDSNVSRSAHARGDAACAAFKLCNRAGVAAPREAQPAGCPDPARPGPARRMFIFYFILANWFRSGFSLHSISADYLYIRAAGAAWGTYRPYSRMHARVLDCWNIFSNKKPLPRRGRGRRS